MTRSRAALAVPLVLSGLLLAGCSSGGGSAGGGDAAATSAEAPAAASDLEAEAGTRDRLAVADSAADGDMAYSAQLDGGARAAVPRRVEEVREPAIISTGTVSLRAKDVGDARFEVQKVVDRVGGQVTDSETRTDEDGSVRTARLVLRVPSDSFTEAVEALERVADLEASSTSSEDVTTQVVDTAVRIRIQRESIARIEQLLARAGSIRDVVAVERQLTTREARLNSLLRQQAYLSDQTSMSTVTVHLQRHRPDGPGPAEEDDQDGFLAGLAAGWDGLSTVAVGLATVAGAVLPFAAALLVLGVPGWLVARPLLRRRRTSAGAGAGTSAPATAAAEG